MGELTSFHRTRQFSLVSRGQAGNAPTWHIATVKIGHQRRFVLIVKKQVFHHLQRNLVGRYSRPAAATLLSRSTVSFLCAPISAYSGVRARRKRYRSSRLVLLLS